MTSDWEFQFVTPEKADSWLADNQFDRQRKLREHHVFTLAEEMEAGHFISHSAIVFARCDGRDYLIDGQHRLSAVSLYGRPVELPIQTMVASDLAQVSRWYASIDQGAKRTSYDAIKAQNLSEELGMSVHHAAYLTAAVKLIASGFQEAGKGALRVAGRSNLVVSDLMRDWSKETLCYYDLIAGGEASTLSLFNRAAVIACALLTLRYQPEKASEFWSGIAADDGLRRDDPRKRLLVWLGLHREKPAMTARAFAVAWRAWIEGRDLELIRFKSTSPIKIEGVPHEEATRESRFSPEILDNWRESHIANKEQAASGAMRPAADCSAARTIRPLTDGRGSSTRGAAGAIVSAIGIRHVSSGAFQSPPSGPR